MFYGSQISPQTPHHECYKDVSACFEYQLSLLEKKVDQLLRKKRYADRLQVLNQIVFMYIVRVPFLLKSEMLTVITVEFLVFYSIAHYHLYHFIIIF